MQWLRILLAALVASAMPLSSSAQKTYDPVGTILRAMEAFDKGDAMPAKQRVEAYLEAIEECVNAIYRNGDRQDRLVEVLYAESLRLAPPELIGQTHNKMARYLNVTERPGPAKKLFQAALADPYFVKNADHEATVLVQLANAYMDQGQISNADAMIQRAEAAIARLQQPTRDRARLNLVTTAMSLRMAQQNPKAVAALWDQLRDILRNRNIDSFEKMSVALATLAYLNQIRDVDRAAQAERILRDNFDTSGFGVPRSMRKEVEAAVIKCMLILATGDPITLAKDPTFSEQYQKCEGIDASILREMRITPARAFELRGNDNDALRIYQEAIDMAEGIRGSFETDERAEFFGGRWRPAYAGVLRIHARAAAAIPTAYYDLTMALLASERARARQFGDLSGGNEPFTGSKEMLDFLRSLPEGTAVVVQTSQDQELVVMSYYAGRYAADVLPMSASQLDKRVTETAALVSDTASDVEDVERSLDALSRDTLGATRALIKDARRIIVLTDGALTRIPFGLFTTTDGGDPLAVTTEITYALSLRSIRTPMVASAATGFFGAGDPVFPSVRPAAGFTLQQVAADANTASVLRMSGETAVFDQLPYTRREIIDVAATFDADAGAKLEDAQAVEFTGASAHVVLGQQASETQAKLALPVARYLHFATHGLMTGDMGLSESAIVLAATDQDDGYLSASEVESLKISAALTVLSACNTGNGRVIAGEGVLGLARSFLIAGSQAALVSLWPVEEESTTYFMIDFYTRLQGGLSPPAALRETSAEMRGLYDHPAYWAAFIMIAR